MNAKPLGLRACARPILQAGIAGALCASLLACIGATPLPKRTLTPAGTEIKDIDLSFIHPGQTTRAEVKEKLKLIDTGYQGDQFFLGRWSSSNWGGWIILVGLCCEAMGGGGRVWKSGNLLVEFDEAGILQRSEPFDDSKVLRRLAPVAAGTPLLLGSPVELSVKYWGTGMAPVDAKIVLSASTFDFEELGDRKKRHKFSLPAQELTKVETPMAMRIPDPTYTTLRLRFARDLKKVGGPGGKNLNLKLTLPQVVTLMSYASQATKIAAPGAADAQHK
jgi:hypothetical protein